MWFKEEGGKYFCRFAFVFYFILQSPWTNLNSMIFLKLKTKNNTKKILISKITPLFTQRKVAGQLRKRQRVLCWSISIISLCSLSRGLLSQITVEPCLLFFSLCQVSPDGGSLKAKLSGCWEHKKVSIRMVGNKKLCSKLSGWLEPRKVWTKLSKWWEDVEKFVQNYPEDGSQ